MENCSLRLVPKVARCAAPSRGISISSLQGRFDSMDAQCPPSGAFVATNEVVELVTGQTCPMRVKWSQPPTPRGSTHEWYHMHLRESLPSPRITCEKKYWRRIDLPRSPRHHLPTSPIVRKQAPREHKHLHQHLLIMTPEKSEERVVGRPFDVHRARSASPLPGLSLEHTHLRAECVSASQIASD